MDARSATEGLPEGELLVASLEDTERVLAATDTPKDRLFTNVALLEACALAAERLGKDQLAQIYAEAGIAHYALKLDPQASCRALLGRLALRQQGDKAAARSHWREAVGLALRAQSPLLALRVIEDWSKRFGRSR